MLHVVYSLHKDRIADNLFIVDGMSQMHFLSTMAKLSGAPPQGTTNVSAGAHAKVTIYYNPKCRKSREALQIIKEKGIDPEIRNYMEEPPSKAELSEVLRKMGRRPRDIFRKSEPLYKDLGLKNKDLTDDELLTYLNEYPILIERPIVVKGQRAVLGRPPEDVRRII